MTRHLSVLSLLRSCRVAKYRAAVPACSQLCNKSYVDSWEMTRIPQPASSWRGYHNRHRLGVFLLVKGNCMTMLRKTALFATLPLLVGLWLTPLASAHERDWRHRHQPAWSYSAPHHQGWRHREQNWKYNKAMNRLDRQEREA